MAFREILRSEHRRLESAAADYSRGAISSADFKQMTLLLGVYEQRNGRYMVRVRIPGGECTPATLRGLAAIGERNGAGYLHLTTRQALWGIDGPAGERTLRAGVVMELHKTSEPDNFAPIPMRSVGPIRIVGPDLDDTVMVPLATYESPLWPSVNRGARVSAACGGIRAVVVDDRMTRSLLVEAESVEAAVRIRGELLTRQAALARRWPRRRATGACLTCTPRSSEACSTFASRCRRATPPGITW